MKPSNPGMHEHDLDLIAALADGSASDEHLARTLIETCAVCRAEFEAQTEVIAWLGAAPTPTMTDIERAELRRGVRAGLMSGPSRAAVTPWWQRLGYVAAGLLVVAGLVGVLQRVEIMGGGDQGPVSDVTTAAADGGQEAPTEDAPFEAEGAGEDTAAPTTTAAAAMDTLASEETLALPFAELAQEARADQTERDATTTSDEDRECLTRVGLDQHVVVREVEESGVTYLVVVPDEPTAEDVVVFVEIPDCRIVHEER
jgi:hypothetical protein